MGGRGSRYRGWLLGWLLLLWLPVVGAVEAVQAFLDRERVRLGETVTLTIQVNGDTAGLQPELTPLFRDFDLLQASSGRQTTVVAGRPVPQTRWSLELEPLRAGEIQVPALRVGQYRTAPLSLRVGTSPAATDSGDVFLEVELSPQTPYVQSQVSMVVRLYYGAPLLEGNLGAPAPASALVTALGEDHGYQVTRGERHYRVVERRYALFPERSGQWRIPPLRFQGRLAGLSQRGQLSYFTTDRGRRVSVESPARTLQVKPRPAHYQGAHWLPSSGLSLHERWSPGTDRVRVGEPITRTVWIRAEGLSGTHLPALSPEPVAQLRSYPAAPETEDQLTGRGVVGSLRQEVAYVPQQAGALRLPAVELHWWDTDSQQARVASLPTREITVLPAALAPPPARPGIPRVAPTPASERVPTSVRLPPWLADRDSPWFLVAMGLALGWLLTLLVWRRARRSRCRCPSPALSPQRRLRAACRRGDAPAAAQLLMAWAASHWPHDPPTNLAALAARLDRGEPEIRILQRVLYAPHEHPWRGGTLWRVLKHGFRESHPPTPPEPRLAPLYPRRS